jgi:two-component system, response regulator / RNA-binding antiterminator
MPLRIMLVNDGDSRSPELGPLLETLGYRVVGVVSDPFQTDAAADELTPDVIIVSSHSPSAAILGRLAALAARAPRPVVMFSSDRKVETIRAATQAGVCAYVVDGLHAARVEPIIDAALARFQESQAMRGELEEVRSRLSDRKAIDRAKGILMKARKLSEDEAYAALRRMAMDRGKRLGEIAQQVIDVASVLN